MSELNALMTPTSAVPSTELAKLQSSSFIPSFNIAYGQSKIVMDDKARPGEFVLGGQTSLGKTTEVVIVDWRLHSVYSEKESGMANGEAWHFPRAGSSTDNAEYQAFIKTTPPADHQLKEGADMLLWIPGQTMFGLFFMKGTLSKLAQKFVDAGSGMRLLTISSVFKEWVEKKTKWFVIDWKPQKLAVVGSPLTDVEATIQIPEDLFQKYYKVWLNPTKGAEVSDEPVKRDR